MPEYQLGLFPTDEKIAVLIDMDEMDSHCSAASGGLLAGLKLSGKDCSLDMPDQWGIGVAHKMSNGVKFVADIMQVNWSSVEAFGDKVVGFGWEDQTIVKFGFEFQGDANNVYRVGFNHGESPIPDEAMALGWLAPAITEDHVTLGMTSKTGKDSEITSYYPESAAGIT